MGFLGWGGMLARSLAPCGGAGRDEVASVLRVAEPREAGEAALEGGRLELAHAGRHQAAQVDHGALVAHRHAATHGEGARQELDDERLHLEGVVVMYSIQESVDN